MKTIKILISKAKFTIDRTRKMNDLFISEIFPSSSVTDAVIATGFFSICDALIVSKGNNLFIYKIQNQNLEPPQCYKLYGEIIRLIPIQQMSVGTLLVILKDFQTCLLSADEFDTTKIIKLSYGTIIHTCGDLLGPPKYAVHPNALVLQTLSFQLEVFPITPDSTLEAPFPIDIGCQKIIDFHFVGPTSKVIRLAVLTEEFHKVPNLRLITIDLNEKKYSEDPEKVALPLDTYLLLPYDPEFKAIIVAFSPNVAIRVSYENLKPDTTTATIFTNSPLKLISLLRKDFYLAIDEDCHLRSAKLEETGRIPFDDICRCPYPTSIAIISNSLAFVGSQTDDSMIYKIEQGHQYELFERVRSTGAALNFFKDNQSIISIFKRAIVEFHIQFRFTIFESIECNAFSKVFPFDLNGKTCYLLSSFKQSAMIGLTEENSLCSACLDQPTLLFSQIAGNLFLQINKTGIYLLDNENVVSSETFEQPILCASIHELTLCISTQSSLHFYQINTELNKFVQQTKNIRINSSECISSVSISNSHLAVSISYPSNFVYVFDLNNCQYQKFEMTGPVVDLLFAFGKLICLNIVDWITVVEYNINETFEIRNNNSINQLNTHLSKLNDSHVLICGKKPFIINSKFEFSSLDHSPILHGINFNDRFVAINCESVMIGQIEPPEFCSTPYFSETMIVDIFKYKEFYITIRKGETGILGMFISNEPLNIVQDFQLQILFKQEMIHDHLNKDEGQNRPFYSFDPREQYRGYHIEKDNFFIATTNRMIRFRIEIESQHFKKIVKIIGCGQLNNQIFNFGTFRDLPYIQSTNQIDFYNVNITNPFDCLFTFMFSLASQDKILKFAFSYQLAAIYTENHKIYSFTFDDFTEKFIPLPPHHTPHTITALSIIGRKILCGTQNGLVFTLEHVCSTNSALSDLIMKESISIDQPISCIKTFDEMNLALVGTEDGMVIALRSISGDSKNQNKLHELYDVLETRITSLGGFSKHFQRVPKEGQFFLTTQKMYDYDLIKTFLSMPRNEQEKILGSKMSVEEAKRRLNIDFIL